PYRRSRVAEVCHLRTNLFECGMQAGRNVEFPSQEKSRRLRDYGWKLPRLAIAAEWNAAHRSERSLLSYRAAVVVHRDVARETRPIRYFQWDRKRRGFQRLQPLERDTLVRILTGFAPRRDQGHEDPVRMRRPFCLFAIIDAGNDRSPHQQFDAESEHHASPPV